MHYLPYLFGVIIIIVGIRTVFTQEATLTIQLWGNGSNGPPNRADNGYTTSEHTGFIAVLIGIAQIATGVTMLVKGPAFFS
jgi:hypothetical protein